MAPPARRVAPSMRAAREPLHVVTLIDLVAEAGEAETLAVELLDRLDPARFAPTLVLYRHLPESSPLHARQERPGRRLEVPGGRIGGPGAPPGPRPAPPRARSAAHA